MSDYLSIFCNCHYYDLPFTDKVLSPREAGEVASPKAA